MAFTYDTTTARGQVRLLVSDTNTSDGTLQIFTDAEVDAFLSLEDQDVYSASAAACLSIATSAARSAVAWRALDTQMDKTKIPDHFQNLAEKYMARSRSGAPTEYIDSMDDRIDAFGRDDSEYVGDQVI